MQLVDALYSWFVLLAPYVTYVCFGGALLEFIVVIYAIKFSSFEEKTKCRNISKAAINKLREKIPVIPGITTDVYTSTGMIGAYEIIPTTIITHFIIVYYVIMPMCYVCSYLTVISEKERDIFYLMLRCAS